jgi:hypothetical protein
MPVPVLRADAMQQTINGHQATLDLYCAMLGNAQGIIVQLLNQNVQNQSPQNPLALRSTIKAPKPEFDGTPGGKACGFITVCTTYQTLCPADFQDNKVFIAWALACITEDSKVASWKAHWLTL